METTLWAHPACPSSILDENIGVALTRVSAGTLQFRYDLRGRIEELVLPPPAPPLRTNNLWKTTCFEAFLAPAETSTYREFNFSPSSQWAAYDFSAYRSGMVQASLHAPPDIQIDRRDDRLVVNVTLSLDIPDHCSVGLAAVLEERGGRKSYWALLHAGSEPDFHRRDCFALKLPPPTPA